MERRKQEEKKENFHLTRFVLVICPEAATKGVL